jgi:hypothetical protein
MSRILLLEIVAQTKRQTNRRETKTVERRKLDTRLTAVLTFGDFVRGKSKLSCARRKGRFGPGDIGLPTSDANRT